MKCTSRAVFSFCVGKDSNCGLKNLVQCVATCKSERIVFNESRVQFCFRFSGPAMSLIESTASFRQRCDEITPEGTLKGALDGQAIRTHRAMAFTMGTPQMAPTEDHFTALATRVFAGLQIAVQMSAIRGIRFESTALVISTIREKDTSEGAEKVDMAKKIPLAEEKQRRGDQLARLDGISMTGELDPNHASPDLANQMLESGEVMWLAPSKCSKRYDEVQMALRDPKSSVQIENSQLRVRPSLESVQAEWNSELKYQWCMMRRGLAFDQRRVLSWSVRQHWPNYMLIWLTPPVSQGFQQFKLDQLVRVDRVPWTLLAQEVTGSLKMDGNEVSLDEHVTLLSTDPREALLLLPMPSNQRVAEAPDKPEPALNAPPAGPAAKGSGKRKTRAGRICPKEPKGYTTTADAGQICWSYDLKDGCQLATNEKPAKCSRELHLCECCHKPGHSMVVCH